MILAIDPGTEESGWVKYEPSGGPALSLLDCGVLPNAQMLAAVRDASDMSSPQARARSTTLAIEMIQSYGMPVGQEVFETCVWIGRFVQAWRDPEAAVLVYRQDVKLRLCGQPRAKDANVRQALLDLFPRTGGGACPQVGTKGKPGPLFGMGTHSWPALGVAIVAAERASPAADGRRRLRDLGGA